MLCNDGLHGALFYDGRGSWKCMLCGELIDRKELEVKRKEKEEKGKEAEIHDRP